MSIDSMLSVSNGIAQGNSGEHFSYCLETASFYVYENGFWRIIDDLELMGKIMRYSNGENNTLNISQFTYAKRNQILDNLKLLVYKKLNDFNKTGHLNFPEGEMDMETGYIHPHDKENYSTFRMPYHFRFGAECELWLKTLKEIMEGSQEKIDMLQEFFGYCLTRDTSQIKALLLLGESNSGKSTILEVLRGVVGKENCSSVPMKFLSNPQYTPQLMNKLVNIDADVSENAKDFEFEFKIIVKGEPVICNQKFVPTFEFFPYSRIVMAANTFPRITDHSSAFYNRLIIIPCDRVFKENEQDKSLNKRLNDELSGIFNWAYEGLQRLQDRGRFEEKDFVREALQDLRDESNPVDVFYRETIAIDISGNDYIAKQDLYNKYVDWCRKNGNAPMSTIKFGKSVYQKYAKITEKKSQNAHGIRIWKNLKYKIPSQGWEE